MPCGGQSMDKSMFFASQTSLVPIHHRRAMEDLGGLGGTNRDPQLGNQQQPSSLPTLLHVLLTVLISVIHWRTLGYVWMLVWSMSRI